jgi:hypothetical protein
MLSPLHKLALLGLVLAVLYNVLEFLLYPSVSDVVFNLDADWGDATAAAPALESAATLPFTLPQLDEAVLHQRLDWYLQHTAPRHRSLADVADRSYGYSAQSLERVVRHWRHEYNWTARALELDAAFAPQYVMRISGLRVHFSHKTGTTNKTALLLHGWPGSYVEFKDLARLLHGQGYNVVVPSLPGFAWSEAPQRAGFSFVECVDVARRPPLDSAAVAGIVPSAANAPLATWAARR